MRVRKTRRHRGLTLAHGRFRVRETERICAAGCTEQPVGTAKRRPLVRRASGVARLLPPRSTIGCDVLAHVGVERFVRFRQREQIRKDLLAGRGIQLSAGEVSSLTRKFCVCLKALQLALPS